MLSGEKKSGQVRLSFWENKQNVNKNSGIQTGRVLTDYLWAGELWVVFSFFLVVYILRFLYVECKWFFSWEEWSWALETVSQRLRGRQVRRRLTLGTGVWDFPVSLWKEEEVSKVKEAIKQENLSLLKAFLRKDAPRTNTEASPLLQVCTPPAADQHSPEPRQPQWNFRSLVYLPLQVG